jgi:flagellar biogenesis protein FliO
VRPTLRWALLVLVLVSIAAPFARAAERPFDERASERQIPFKQSEESGTGLVLRVVGGLAVATLVGIGAIFAVRRYPPSAYHTTFGGPSHVKVVEIRRLTPRTTLFVVDFDGVRLLLGQTGDRIVALSENQKAAGASDTAES